MSQKWRYALYGNILLIAFLLCHCGVVQRAVLFYPSHKELKNGLVEWRHEGRLIGYQRPVKDPEHIWLMLHGNAGQAQNRWSCMDSFSPRDAVFVLEYPGFGQRPGMPTRRSMDAAASEAYQLLRRQHPHLPIGLVGESIGGGPVGVLAGGQPPPQHVVLIVPFDSLEAVAKKHYPAWFVKLVLEADWDNVESLRNYKGPLDIYAATEDRVIPIAHAQRLAREVKQASLIEMPGGHNDWGYSGMVRIRMEDDPARE